MIVNIVIYNLRVLKVVRIVTTFWASPKHGFFLKKDGHECVTAKGSASVSTFHRHTPIVKRTMMKEMYFVREDVHREREIGKDKNKGKSENEQYGLDS